MKLYLGTHVVLPSTEGTQHSSETAQLWWCIILLWAQMELKAPAACFKHEERFTGTVDGLRPHRVASAPLEHSVSASGGPDRHLHRKAQADP